MTGAMARNGGSILVFPAASRPSINRRISLDPKTLAIILDIEAPMMSAIRYTLLGWASKVPTLADRRGESRRYVGDSEL